MTELCMHPKFRTLPVVYLYSFSVVMCIDRVSTVYMYIMNHNYLEVIFLLC